MASEVHLLRPHGDHQRTQDVLWPLPANGGRHCAVPRQGEAPRGRPRVHREVRGEAGEADDEAIVSAPASLPYARPYLCSAVGGLLRWLLQETSSVICLPRLLVVRMARRHRTTIRTIPTVCRTLVRRLHMTSLASASPSPTVFSAKRSETTELQKQIKPGICFGSFTVSHLISLTRLCFVLPSWRPSDALHTSPVTGILWQQPTSTLRMKMPIWL